MAKRKKVDDLISANRELAFQDDEKEKRAAELSIANKELAFQNDEKEKRAAELIIANKELVFQNEEKEKRAEELAIANKELAFQNDEKEKRAAELSIANKELAFQNDEKEKRAAELIIANDELLFQNEEKEKRANELIIANKELNQSEKLLQKSLKEVSDYKDALDQTTIIAITDQKGIIKKVNSNFCKISKYKEEELIGQDHRILNSGYHPKKFIQDLWKTIANGKVWKGEIKNKAKDGTFYWVDTTIVPFLDKKGRPYQYLAIRIDVTQRKESEEQLIIINKDLELQNKEKEKRAAQLSIANYARSLIEASRDPLFTISPEGKITDMNQATIRVTEKSREQLIDTYFSNYFTEPKKAQEGYEKVFEQDYVVDYPLTIVDGTKTAVLFNGSVYKDDKGNVVGAVVVARDITEQKRIEKELIKAKVSAELASKYARSLIEASLDPLVTINADGKITDVNNASIEYTGVEREILIGTDFSDYFTEPEKAREGYLKVFEKGYVEDYPLTIKHLNGDLIDVLYNASVYKDDNGNVIGVFAAARDITDQKRIATELFDAKLFAERATSIAEEAKMKAENAVKAKQQFLSNMSHEIRTPMNAIIGFTKVMLKTDLTLKQSEYLNAIKVSGNALIVLINDILDLAKVDAGKMTFEQMPFKMALSTSTMLHLFETKIQEKNLVLIKEYDDNIPDVLLGDPVRLHQIILNLVSNAVKFTTKGSIKVSIRLIDEDEEKVNIEFAVSDTGMGISADKLDHIFDNFQQATSDTSRLYGGTGLGLAIVKQLVEPQGGTIKVISELDEGTTFSFVLSFQKTNQEADSDSELVELDKEIKNIKVLVVEDIALNQLLMKTLLDDFGFDRDIASNGKIAIEKLKIKDYDIILMDLQMPEMNGFEATTYIRDILNSKIPIIALTADVTTVDLEKCKAVGMNDYIAKPVDERVLYHKIVSLVSKPIQIEPIETKEYKRTAIKKVKCIDLTYLNQRTKSSPELMMEMISLYLEQTPTLISTMRQSFDEKNWEILSAAAHKMIPSFSIVGMHVDFENITKEIQEHANAKQKTETIHNMIEQIENICNQACVELEIEFNKIKNNNQ